MGSERRRSTPSLDERSASRSEMAEAVPSEFLCPISGALMADPVIVPTGESFERSCIQACSDLAFTPPSLGLSTTSSSSSSLLLIPNVALKSAILNWCELNGLPRPRPLHPTPLATSFAASWRRPRTRRPQNPASALRAHEEGAPLFFSFASSETRKFEAPVGASIAGDYCSEEDILIKLLDPDPSDHEAAMVSLRSATRENRERRIALCTPRILAALRATLLSKRAAVQINAAAAMVNLSLEAPNKAAIVRSGAVPRSWRCSRRGTRRRATTRRARSTASPWTSRTARRSASWARSRRWCSSSAAEWPVVRGGTARGATRGRRSTTSLSRR
uniref:RING-type E3 ubiquitin transferase n=1 Tax=Ananas comosus var. bracteatus TaxID=296719 RepID=A0A6V7P7K2_ANACO|nr:unnamed protein product [Ananas comosus var. bracteatus]